MAAVTTIKLALGLVLLCLTTAAIIGAAAVAAAAASVFHDHFVFVFVNVKPPRYTDTIIQDTAGPVFRSGFLTEKVCSDERYSACFSAFAASAFSSAFWAVFCGLNDWRAVVTRPVLGIVSVSSVSRCAHVHAHALKVSIMIIRHAAATMFDRVGMVRMPRHCTGLT